MDRLARHENALLAAGRCRACAEPVAPRAIVRGDDCPRCGAPLTWNADGAASDAFEAVVRRWRARAVVIYTVAGAASLIGGNVPLLHAILTFTALLLVNVGLLRGALGWLTGARALFARVGVRLLFAAIAASNLFLDLLLLPLPGVRAVVLAGAGLVSLLLFVELSLWMLRTRLAWDRAHAPLKVLEWILPATLLGGLIAGVLGLSLALTAVLYALASVQLWGVSDIARFLLDVQ